TPPIAPLPRMVARTPATNDRPTDRLPETLAPGELSGISDAPAVSHETRHPGTVRMAAAPKRTADSGGNGEENRVPDGGKPVPGPGGAKAGEGTGEEGARGDARGPRAGVTAAIGIDRGIPFGAKLGIYPAAPAATDASISNEGGQFHVSLKRTS